MPEVVTLDKKNNHILITSSGKPNLSHLMGAINKSLALYEEKGVDKLLVDSIARNRLPTAKEAAKGAEFLAEKTSSKLRIAVLVADQLEWHTDFSRKVGMKFGLIRYFANRDEAVKWLHHD